MICLTNAIGEKEKKTRLPSTHWKAKIDHRQIWDKDLWKKVSYVQYVHRGYFYLITVKIIKILWNIITIKTTFFYLNVFCHFDQYILAEWNYRIQKMNGSILHSKLISNLQLFKCKEWSDLHSWYSRLHLPVLPLAVLPLILSSSHLQTRHVTHCGCLFLVSISR